MATRTTLKGYFETGDKPTQAQFAELIEGVPNLTDGSVTDAEFSYLNGTTSPIQTQIDGKQETLVNQTNIKSVNGVTLLGSGDLAVSSSAAWGGITGTLSSQTDLQSALDAKEDVIAAGTTSEYYRGDKSFQTLDKTAVGLPNVDNTSDANKPVSTAGQTALDLKADLTGATFTGAVSATNLSGTNTGDQDISGIATNTSAIATNTTAIATKLSTTGGAMTGAITGNVAIQGFRPYLTETAGRTLTVTDSGTFIIADDAANITFEIPLNDDEAFTLGTEIDFIQKGSGALRITSTTGVTLNGVDPNSVIVTAQWGGVTIKKIAEDEWIAVGKI